MPPMRASTGNVRIPPGRGVPACVNTSSYASPKKKPRPSSSARSTIDGFAGTCRSYGRPVFRHLYRQACQMQTNEKNDVCEQAENDRRVQKFEGGEKSKSK